MGLVETEALVLKCYSLAEADKIVLLLTRNQGLVRGVAKGAKRLKSRFGGGLEPFSIVNVTYFHKEERELVSIDRIELLKSFFELAGEPEFQQKLSYLLELLTEFAPPHDPNERLYRMARICLETAAADARVLSSVVVYFELWILRLAGFLPDWSRCDRCKKTIGQGSEALLQANFQLNCMNCQKISRDRTISPAQREIFAAAQRFPPDRFAAATSELGNDLIAVSSILKRIISQILGREMTGERSTAANGVK